MNPTETQRQKFLSLAAEADQKALENSDQTTGENWRSIADSYRALAKALKKIKR